MCRLKTGSTLLAVLTLGVSFQAKAQEPQRGGGSQPEAVKPVSTTERKPAIKSQPDGDTNAAGRDQRTSAIRSELGMGRAASEGPAAIAPIIQEPSQGRPIFITPGETFYFVMSLPDSLKGDVTFALRSALEPGLRIPLKPTTPPSYTAEYCTLLLLVSGETPPGLYDLEVTAKGGKFYSRHSVKVLDAFKNKFRFVHLSNMNVGDLTAPEFDEMLPKEINLLAPEFIIATGDYTEWARARDDAGSWLRVLKYFEQFNAPVFMLCGQHDHEASYSRYVAKDPIGTIDYGGYHGLLLLDHPGHPIEQDYNQLQWAETDLKRSRQKRFNFIACNSDELGILDVWNERGGLPAFIKDHKIRMIITGGSTDWDTREFAKKLSGVEGLELVRTHQASTALRDRATGVSHYRVIEVDGDQIACNYPDDNASEKLRHSIPTGRLRTYFETPNDGSSRRVIVTVQNALNQGFSNVRLWLRLAKSGAGRPSVAPGKLERTLDMGSYWACDISLDLPDKGATRVMASVNPEDIPPALPIEIELTGSREWKFAEKSTDFGLTYFHADAEATLRLTNRSRQDITCWPVIRVNGSMIHADRKAVPRLPVTIAAGKSVTIPLVLDLRRVSPGRHALQVHFLEDPLSRLTTFDVELAAL